MFLTYRFGFCTVLPDSLKQEPLVFSPFLPPSLRPPPGFCYSVCHFYIIKTPSICILLHKSNSQLFVLDLYSKGSNPPFHHIHMLWFILKVTGFHSQVTFPPGVGNYFTSWVSYTRISVLLPCFWTASWLHLTFFSKIYFFIHWVCVSSYKRECAPQACLISSEARRGRLIPRKWRYQAVWAVWCPC